MPLGQYPLLVVSCIHKDGAALPSSPETVVGPAHFYFTARCRPSSLPLVNILLLPQNGLNWERHNKVLAGPFVQNILLRSHRRLLTVFPSSSVAHNFPSASIACTSPFSSGARIFSFSPVARIRHIQQCHHLRQQCVIYY